MAERHAASQMKAVDEGRGGHAPPWSCHAAFEATASGCQSATAGELSANILSHAGGVVVVPPSEAIAIANNSHHAELFDRDTMY